MAFTFKIGRDVMGCSHPVPPETVTNAAFNTLIYLSMASVYLIGFARKELLFQMYLEFYNLSEKPFQITCDPKFLWLGDRHKDALDKLSNGIKEDCGFVLLTGEVGTGKTVLVNKLLTLLPDNIVVGRLSIPEIESMDFCKYLGNCFQFPSPIESKAEFLIQLDAYLRKCAANYQRVVLIIDEAQGLKHNVLEDIRSVSSLEFPDKKLISIFLVGQPELNQELMNKENRALMQRFTSRCHIEPLDGDETASYIRYRLETAGGAQTIFKEDAIRKIFEYTAGIPRVINILCDHCLLSGSVYKLQEIDGEIIEECVRELKISSQLFTPETPDPNKPDPVTFRETPGKALEPEPQPAYYRDANTPKPSFFKWIPHGVVLLVLLFLALGVMGVINKTIARRSDGTTIEEHQKGASEKSDPPVADKAEQPVAHKIQLPPQAHDSSAPVTERVAAPGWPEDMKIHIEFDPENQITASSAAAIDQVAEDLIQFPERIVYIHGVGGGTGSPERRAAIWRMRVNCVRSRLISQGASLDQIELASIGSIDIDATLDISANHFAMMELPRYEYAKAYNQDK